jgi:hypothetical protein
MTVSVLILSENGTVGCYIVDPWIGLRILTLDILGCEPKMKCSVRLATVLLLSIHGTKVGEWEIREVAELGSVSVGLRR